MSVALIAILMFGSMIALLLTGRHIIFIIGAIGTASAFFLWGTGGVEMPYFAMYGLINWWLLLTIPLFVFMGFMLAKSGVAENLFHALYLWVGHIKGGLAMADVGLSALVAAMSGTNVASETTSCSISLPAMLKRKYDKRLALGIVLAGGGIGFLIPPSVVFIIYGLIARVSIGRLWLSGILPGILLSVMNIIYIAIRCHFQPHLGPPIPPEEQVGWEAKFRAMKNGIAPIVLIFVVLGLFFMGVTSLVECAVIGGLGAIVCAAIHRRLTWQLVTASIDGSLKVTAMVMWVFSAALVFGAVFDGLGAIEVVGHMLAMVGGGRWGTMIAMQASFFLLGTSLDDTALLLIVAPLYIPLVAHLGFNLIWYGTLYILNMQMAMISPPFGYSLFIMKGIIPQVAPDSGITLGKIYRSVIPFIGIQALALAMVMVFPQIALWLPNRLMGGLTGG